MKRRTEYEHHENHKSKPSIYGHEFLDDSIVKVRKPRQSKQIKLFRMFFWFCFLVFVFSSSSLLLKADFKIAQKNVVQKIDLTSRINVCNEEENVKSNILKTEK